MQVNVGAQTRILRLMLASIALLVGACGRGGPLSGDPALATRQANALLPKGTPEKRATSILQGRGFHVSRLHSDKPANHLVIGTCTRRKQTWLVGVVIVDGRVAACSVTVNTEP